MNRPAVDLLEPHLANIDARYNGGALNKMQHRKLCEKARLSAHHIVEFELLLEGARDTGLAYRSAQMLDTGELSLHVDDDSAGAWLAYLISAGYGFSDAIAYSCKSTGDTITEALGPCARRVTVTFCRQAMQVAA